MMDERVTFAAFWKMKPSAYDPEPEWRQYSEWLEVSGYAEEVRDRIARNPRCAEAAVFRRIERYEMIDGSVIGGAGC